MAPDGVPVAADHWASCMDAWLPTGDDKDFVSSLMQPVTAQGKIAGWIAPPPRGINGHPFDYEYVRLI